MQLQVKGKNFEVTEPIRTYAEKRLGRLEKRLPTSTRVEVELQVEKNPSIADSQIAEATIWTKRRPLRAHAAASDMREAIDLLTDKLERQAVRYKDKLRSGRHRDEALKLPPAAVEVGPADAEAE